MDTVIRNVADLTADERHTYERLLGQPLQDNQRVIVQLVRPDNGTRPLPIRWKGAENLEPYAIWADLGDAEIADLESGILDRSESRLP